MVEADVYFGDDFGQKIDLTVRIREILRNYPEGASIFKEMVQNADDAGATEVNLCLDYRQHASTGLAYEKLGSFQGPSLLVHNNATFTDADFQSIQRIGDSLKKNNSKGWKTGRFGVGFNSVYHVSDLPAFVSGSQLVFFDPQACHLPNVNPSNPGKMIDFVAHPDLVNNFPDQMIPFRCFGCNFTEPFSGTIFRLALRTEEQAQRSKLSNRAQTPANMAACLEEFAADLPTVLLFLRNVCKICIWEWKAGDEDPTALHEASINNMTEEIEAKRSLQHSSLGHTKQLAFSSDGLICDYPLTIEARDFTAGLFNEYDYLIMNQLGGGECTKIACDPINSSHRLVPWGGVAVSTTADAAISSLSGLAFCFLPLPTHTYLPVHVNGYFELSSNRRDIWFGDGLSGDGLLRANWNIALLQDVIAPCYARAILHLASNNVMPPNRHAQLLPQALPPAPWDSLTYSLFSLLRNKPCLYNEDGGGRWVSPMECFVIRSSYSSSKHLEQLLLDDGFPVVRNLAEDLERLLVMTNTIPSYVEPQAVREAYSLKHSCHAANAEAVECLLSFMLSDLEPGRLGDLVGVNFLPLADGTLQTFEKSGTSNFFIPTQMQLDLLEKARGHLVDIEAVSASALELLSSASAKTRLNVSLLDNQGFGDMLAIVLPAAWLGKLTVPWSMEAEAPTEQWVRQLWKYIGTSNHLATFKDKWPIVPTSSDILTQLSVSAGILCAELIPDGCLVCLQKIQVRLLLPSLFATFLPDLDVWHYIHQPTAAGVLTCIGVVLGEDHLTHSNRASELFEAADKSDRDHLLNFLSTSTDEDIRAHHKQICCSLPIFPGFQNVDDNFSPSCVSLAEIESKHDKTLFCMGIPPKFLDDKFVFVKEGDMTLVNFLLRLGARQISKVEFFAKHFIPRLNSIKPTSRVTFVYYLLAELPNLIPVDTDGILSSIIETVPIFPTMTGDLKSIDNLYDPDIEEFVEIMDDSFFPALELQDPQPLSALRSIGLQRALSRRSILSLAVSLEDDQLKISSGIAEESQLNEMCEKLRSRSVKFFHYIDAHVDQLVTTDSLQRQTPTHVKKSKKSKGIRFLRNILGDDRQRGRGLHALHDDNQPTMEQLEEQAMVRAEIEDFKAKLALIEWIPVCEEKPHPAAPWYKLGEQVIVASPQQSRPTKQLWLCSTQFHIIKCPVHSDALREIMGWDKPLPVETIAAQLKELSRLTESDSDLNTRSDVDNHMVWSAVYSIYRVLSTFFETERGERRGQVLSILSGNGKYVWVGDHFVSATHVATVVVVNAEPYLYTVPGELLHFRPFLRAIGVRERFSLADYVHVLGAMHKECLVAASAEESDVDVSPIYGDKLTTVIGLIQLISDTLQHHSDYELFAPNRDGVLELASNLTYDDTPWLDKHDYETTSGSTHFIHPKISNEVAAKIGSRSLRSQLLSESGHEAMSFRAEGDVEAFGQTEALTKRIAHILEQYPEGPNIISELIQNADDAGATRVCVLYNSCTYGTSSLLSPAMAKWQGPSLYCYNDAEFSDGDFINLARIGQASKLQRAATTGRFGLGFNSVYHFTDLPSIVSANSIVMFDPHATHLPGISAANPGIKIRFANSNIVKQFPDQFAPFRNVFGCDLDQRFKGTLFRFPLRNASLAETSEIKRRGYSHHEIEDLLRSFYGSITDTMLFLRNVRKVEVYLQSEIDQPPTFLYGAEVPEQNRGESWRKIDRFMRNDDLPGTTDVSAKRDFYARLRSTPQEDLPSVTQVLHIRRQQRKDLQEIFRRFGDETEKLVDGEMEGSSEKYLVCNQIGGGNARDMACASENESLKLIPWVGIASRIDGVPMEGRAFCFLPLPVRVGLPVHVNAYFELSSNRRDIWHGDDMTGEGKLRSEWNSSLLVDAVAPAYLNFLLEAKTMWEADSSQYLSFFPKKMPTSPWDSIVPQLFRIMKTRPVFFASPAQLEGSIPSEIVSSVNPGDCVLVDDSLNDWKSLQVALTTASLATVHLPAPLRNLLIQFDGVHGAMTPDFFRMLTRKRNFLPALEQDILVRVVQFCLSDCQGSMDPYATKVLDQLPLIPLKDGKFGRFSFIDKSSQDGSNVSSQKLEYFFGNASEENLLDQFSHRVIRREFKHLFDQLPSVYDSSNLNVVDLTTILDSFLPHVLGRCWRTTKEDVFAFDTSSNGNESESQKDWIRLLWTYVETQLASIEQLPQSFMKWPLVPIVCEEGNDWVCLSAKVSLVLSHVESAVSSELLCKLQPALTKVGIHIVDTSVVSGDKTVQWMLTHKYGHKLTPNGVLAALSRYQLHHERQNFDEIFTSTTATERQVLCDFFSQNTYDAVSDEYQSTLFELPIFPVYAKDEACDEVSFVSLKRGGYLPDEDADPNILDDSFFCVNRDSTRRFLRDCGVDYWSLTKILLDHVFPQLPAFEARDSALVDSVVVRALEELPFHQSKDSRFRAAITTSQFIPSRKRVFRAVNELHDPSVSELSDLVGQNSLPDYAFSTPPIVEILRSLGLRTGLSCHAVLESARSIEAMFDEHNEASTDRAYLKAQSLLSIVNKHFDTMLSESNSGETTAGQDGNTEGVNLPAMHDVVADLREVRWLPARVNPPDPAMPWKSSSGSEGNGPLLSSANKVRPLRDAWFCSSSMNILDGELTSEKLVIGFGWKGQVDSLVIAKQLEALASRWEDYSCKKDKDAATTWRFPLSEVHQMYELLESSRMSDDEGWKTSAVYRKLANTMWIWTGREFAYPCQLAIDADANLEPLLFCCPSEHIIPRSLLASFDLKDTFGTGDYLEAIMRIPQNVVLSDKQVAACARIYEIIGRDTASLQLVVGSFASQEMVLLDQSNQLVPAVQLLFDDMEWNESSEVRRGARFVSKEVPKDIAGLLGAASLHSRLAETSVTSRRVVSPSASALASALPIPSEWCHTLFWETILAAERFGGTQVDLFLDYRHHSSQRVIQPSLQPLQDEALCIHIHGMVLSEDDINNLFHGESSRPGLLSGFIVSDCMQILSGEGFYILDPTGRYLSPSAETVSTSTGGRGANVGRRYEVLNQDFVRYPDQLLPFTTLPSCPSNVSEGTQSTLIRFPWRKTESAVSSFVLDATKVDTLITFIKSQLYQTLIFTESVHRASIWGVGKESEFASHCHGEASLDLPDRTLRKRNMTRQNEEWKKKFSFQSFFKSPVIPENQMEFTVNFELENCQYRDTWLFSDNIGMGRSRDLACTAVHEMLHSQPYVSIACHLLRNGGPAPRLRGHVYKIVDTHQQVALPVHINGCFKKTLKDKQLALTLPSNQTGREGDVGDVGGSEQQIAAGWNRILLEDGVSDAYVKLLMGAKRRYEGVFPDALYNIWPTLRGENDLGALVQARTYHVLSTRELFLCTDGMFRALSNGYQLDVGGMNSQVASFAQHHFPVFKIPIRLLRDCSRLLPSRMSAVTPKVLRRFLRSMSSSEVHSDVGLSLLEYCLSDLPFPLPSETDPVWAEFHGLSLLPLEDGSIGVFRVNQRRTSYVLASFNQIELLRPLGHLFVSLTASQRLHKYFTDSRFTTVFGLETFSIKTLSDNIERVLPPYWKNKPIVQWDPTSPTEIDQLWLHRFWQVIHFERRSLAYFSSWPLIPVKGSRLVSCSKMDIAVCVWDGSADIEISASVIEAFSNSAEEAEHKRLVELSLAKFQKEELIANGSSSDEEESGAEDDDAVDEEYNNEETADDSDEGSSVDGVSFAADVNDISFQPAQHTELSAFTAEGSLANEDTDLEVPLSPDSIALALEDSDESSDDDANGAEREVIDDGFAVPVYPVEDEQHEFCSRETLHNVLSDLDVPLMELAYFTGQASDIVPRSVEIGVTVLDGIFALEWEKLQWNDLSETRAVFIAEFFSQNGDAYGGYNRIQLEKLKQLPIYVNIRDVPCAIHGQEFFLIPPDLNLTDVPLPPDAQHCFLKSNSRLNAFYKDLGVQEMSDSKLLIYVLPMYSELQKSQRDQILHLLLHKWQSLRGNAELVALLKSSLLFRDDESDGASYHAASVYCDPRNSVLSTIYEGVPGHFPAREYRTSEWLDLMGEIGMQTEVTVDIFVECAQRIDEQCSSKQELTREDMNLITTLHQFFVQNFDKFDRSRSFFERITALAFVPAVVYDASIDEDLPSKRRSGQYVSRTVVRKYTECATLDDQALVFSTMPIMVNVALPPRILYSRMGIKSPPPQHQIVLHLLAITKADLPLSARSLDWRFFLPMVEVFQTIFKYLQEHWDELEAKTQQRLTIAAVIPVGSTLVKGSRLFFHLGENLAPLMFEVPRAFGAYDMLFRHMGAKESPEVSDYIRLLHDLSEECCGHPLNLNELIAVARAIELLATALTESNHRLTLDEKKSIYLPSGMAVMQSVLVMAYNDSAALCASIDLTELHVVHPRISTRCCKMLGVPGITSVVSEELDGSDNPTELMTSDEIAHFNSVLTSQHFADGLRKIITTQQQKATTYEAFGFIPDFDDLNQRISNLATYEVKCVTKLRARFIAKLDFPARRLDVTKTTRQDSLSFLDQTKRRIYIANNSRSQMGMRASHLVARCINQLLDGLLQDCAVLESILTCDEMDIPEVLQLLDIYEDPILIVEKLRGVLGQPLSEADCANVDLAPLRSCMPGELVAVEDGSGMLSYAKIVREQPSDVAGVSRYEVKLNSSLTRWMLATELYFFRSARVGTSDNSSYLQSERHAGSSGIASPLENVALPASVVPITLDVREGDIVSGFGGVINSTSAVSSTNVLSAVNDLLSRLNVSLDLSVEELLAENLRLQGRLEVAEASRRSAATQMDSVIREKKEAEDSLVCAVCLENRVNRVLIPCGHIYCASCVEQLPRPSCPICRQNIAQSSVFHVPS